MNLAWLRCTTRQIDRSQLDETIQMGTAVSCPLSNMKREQQYARYGSVDVDEGLEQLGGATEDSNMSLGSGHQHLAPTASVVMRWVLQRVCQYHDVHGTLRRRRRVTCHTAGTELHSQPLSTISGTQGCTSMSTTKRTYVEVLQPILSASYCE